VQLYLTCKLGWEGREVAALPNGDVWYPSSGFGNRAADDNLGLTINGSSTYG